MSHTWAQMWSDKYAALQLAAIGARATGNHEREREALDGLHQLDKLNKGVPPMDLVGWSHFDGCVICPANHWIGCEDDLPSIMAAIAAHECDGG